MSIKYFVTKVPNVKKCIFFLRKLAQRHVELARLLLYLFYLTQFNICLNLKNLDIFLFDEII